MTRFEETARKIYDKRVQEQRFESWILDNQIFILLKLIETYHAVSVLADPKYRFDIEKFMDWYSEETTEP